MKNYIIEKLIDYDCDNNGLLSVSFKIEGDPEDTYRFIETYDYYYYAEESCKDDETYRLMEWEEGDEETDGYYYHQFDFREWKDYEHSEEIVKEFIYEYYPNKKDLPNTEND